MSNEKLKNLTSKIGSGSTPRGGKSSYLEQGPYKLIRSQNIYNHYYTSDGLAYITNEQAEKLKNVSLEKRDILINITGDSVARTTIVENDMLPGRVNQHVSIIRCKENLLDPYYLLAFLTSKMTQSYLLSLAQVGGTRAALTKGMLEQLDIPLLNYEKQKKIGKMLKIINEKINLNNSIILSLEQLSQTLFKQWFIDFEFPNEEGKPYKSRGGEFKEIKDEEIPINWKIGVLDDIVEVIYGAAFSSKFFNEVGNGLPLIRIRDLKKGKPQFFTNEIHKKATVINPGDLLIGMDAEFKPTLWKGTKAYLNQRICLVRPKKNIINKLFLKFLLEPQMRFLESAKVGTTVIHLSKKDIDSINIAIPTESILKKFSILIDPILEEIIIKQKEIQSLTQLRDTLLPKLLSGEIEIPNDLEV